MGEPFIRATDALAEMVKDMSDEERIEYDYYSILGTISRAIVQYRIKYNLTQSQLAEHLGVSRKVVARYESGDHDISIKKLNELCAKLDLNITLTIEPKDPDGSVH